MQPDNRPGKPKPRPIMDMYPASRSPQSTGSSVQKISIKDAEQPKEPARNQPKKVPAHGTERPSAAFLLTLLLLLLLLVGGGGAAYYFLKYKPAHKPITHAATTTPDNTNHITNDTLGIKFAITKDLTPTPNTDLVRQNPAFVYGFKQKDVPNVVCVISQQKRTPPGGPVNPESLRDGTLKGIQKSFPDAKLVDYQDTALINGQDAASLVVSYTDKVAIKQKLIVAATKTTVTFAFCSSPEPLYSVYEAKFEPFFNSLEVY